MCVLNVYIICNDEKVESVSVRLGRGWQFATLCVPANSFGVINEMDVCRTVVNQQDLVLIKRQRQPELLKWGIKSNEASDILSSAQNEPVEILIKDDEQLMECTCVTQSCI